MLTQEDRLKKSETRFTNLSMDKIPVSLRKYKNILNTLEEKTRLLKSGSKGSKDSLAFSQSTNCKEIIDFCLLSREEIISRRF